MTSPGEGGSEHIEDGKDNPGMGSYENLLAELEQRDVPPSREVQADRLLAMQEAQLNALESSGILEVARNAVGENANDPLTHIAVSLTKHNQDNGDNVDVASLQFATTEINQYGHEQRRFRNALVADSYEGMVTPREGYTHDQADAIMKLIEDLRAAKADGILPDLDSNLASIR